MSSSCCTALLALLLLTKGGSALGVEVAEVFGEFGNEDIFDILDMLEIFEILEAFDNGVFEGFEGFEGFEEGGVWCGVVSGLVVGVDVVSTSIGSNKVAKTKFASSWSKKFTENIIGLPPLSK